eukprot:800298_1
MAGYKQTHPNMKNHRKEGNRQWNQLREDHHCDGTKWTKHSSVDKWPQAFHNGAASKLQEWDLIFKERKAKNKRRLFFGPRRNGRAQQRTRDISSLGQDGMVVHHNHNNGMVVHRVSLHHKQPQQWHRSIHNIMNDRNVGDLHHTVSLITFCNFDALDVEGDICMEHLFETNSAILQSRESAKNRRDESVTHQVPRKEFKMMEREDLYSSSDDEIHVQFRKQRSDALKNVMPSLRKKWQRQKKKKKKPKAKKKTNAKKKTKAKEKSKKSKKSKNKRNTNSNNNNKRQVDDDGSSCSSSDDDVPIR